MYVCISVYAYLYMYTSYFHWVLNVSVDCKHCLLSFFLSCLLSFFFFSLLSSFFPLLYAISLILLQPWFFFFGAFHPVFTRNFWWLCRLCIQECHCCVYVILLLKRCFTLFCVLIRYLHGMSIYIYIYMPLQPANMILPVLYICYANFAKTLLLLLREPF